MAKQVFEALLERHEPKLVADNFVFVIEEMRKQLASERDRLAEAVFRTLLESEEMRFMVVADDLGFNRLPEKVERREGRGEGNSAGRKPVPAQPVRP